MENQLREEFKIDDDIESMFDDEDDGDYESYDLECVSINENFSNLIESSIQLIENEKVVFESLLEQDFITSMNESMLYEDAEEFEKKNNEKKEKIIAQINKVIAGTKEANKQSSAKIYTEFGRIIKSDSKNMDKYLKLISKTDFKDFVGISNFCFPNDSIANAIDDVEDLAPILKALNKACNKILSADSKEDIDTIYDEFNLSIESIKDDLNESIKKATEKQSNWKPSKKDITLMKCFAKGDIVKEAISKSCNKADNCIYRFKKSMQKYIQEISSQSGEIQVLKMDTVYRCTSLSCRIILNKIQAFQNLEIKEIAAYRRAILTCGKYAADLSKGVNESVEMQEYNNRIIGESSDLYIYERFNH